MSRLLDSLQDGVLGPMTENERHRFLAGRADWPEERWEDHCGNPDCEDCGENLVHARHPRPRLRMLA